MKLSTKVRYGTRAMIELAKQPQDKLVPLRVLAKNQQISPKYLEQITAALKIAGLLKSVRGPEGGYRLSRPADKITVWDIYSVLDITVEPLECLSSYCERMKFCAARTLWTELDKSIATVLKSRTLKQLAKCEIDLQKKHVKSRSTGQSTSKKTG